MMMMMMMMMKEIKKQKAQQSVMKRKVEDYKSCVEANQLEKEINYLEINKIAVVSLRENNKEFIQNHRSINIKITAKI